MNDNRTGAESKSGKYFKKLYDLIISEENILLAYRNLKRNTGRRTIGQTIIMSIH